MKNTIYGIAAFWLFSLSAFSANAQTENYKKGLDAMKDSRYHVAMASFTKVVEDEKYEISGKELSMAYAYLAIIRTAYLESDLADLSIQNILQKQGHIFLAIHEITRAVKFQDKNTKAMLNDPKARMIRLSTSALQVIGDSLVKSDANRPDASSVFLSEFAITQFGDLEQIVEKNWQLYDVLGLAHFHLNEKEKAMVEFQKSRTHFSTLEIKPISDIHLLNLTLSGSYYFKDQNDFKKAEAVSKDGISYTSILINALDGNQMKEILKLNEVENRFRQYIKQIKNPADNSAD